ncbi:hypothetical protein Tco_1417314 [Tanacetum coccineum]
MRSDELYKFSDGTLTRLLSSLEDITKNIDMEYLPKRRRSNLEKKRAHFMIKDINKLLKERRMMRSLEKFVGEHAEFDESNTYVLERFDTLAGNPVKEILLKLNLPDYRSILTDSKMEVKLIRGGKSLKGSRRNEMVDVLLGSDLEIRGVLNGDTKTKLVGKISEPSIVLGDECVMSMNVDNALFGRVKVFASLANLKMALGNEGFSDIVIKYMGEQWVMLEFKSLESMDIIQKIIAEKWGKLLDVDDQDETCFHSKRLCVYLKAGNSIREDFKITHRDNLDVKDTNSEDRFEDPPGSANGLYQWSLQVMDSKWKEVIAKFGRNSLEHKERKEVEVNGKNIDDYWCDMLLKRVKKNKALWDFLPFRVPANKDDGRPAILLKEIWLRFGPTPFRFFPSLLEMDGFNTFRGEHLEKNQSYGKFGFGDKWRKMVQCLSSFFANGSSLSMESTAEFHFGRGLKQVKLTSYTRIGLAIDLLLHAETIIVNKGQLDSLMSCIFLSLREIIGMEAMLNGIRFRTDSRKLAILRRYEEILEDMSYENYKREEIKGGAIQVDRALEKEVAEIKKDPLHTQVISLVDEHLDTRLGETKEELMNFLLESLTARIKEQVKDQLPQILTKEVSNFAPPVIKKMIEESRNEVTLANVSSQPQSTYESASTLTEFELKKILLDKMEKSESYLTAPEHRDCYDGLKKSYALDKDFFYSYDVYSLKRGRKDKDKDEDPSAGSNRGLKKRKLSKDAEPTTEQKKKDSTSGSSKGTKSQLKSSGKSIQSEEPVFEVADLDMPQDQEGKMGDNKDEPRKETASRSDWFKKPTPPQEPTDPDWNIGKTT